MLYRTELFDVKEDIYILRDIYLTKEDQFKVGYTDNNIAIERFPTGIGNKFNKITDISKTGCRVKIAQKKDRVARKSCPVSAFIV